MANQDKETFLELKEHNVDRFADTDFQLRSGMHIQDYKQQSRNFHFLEDNFQELYSFYEKLYQAKLCVYQSINGKFYYLDYFEEQKSKLQKESLKPKQTLFAIFLYTLHRIEKRFSTTLSKQELVEVLNNHSKIKPHIHRLFLGEEQEDTMPTQATLLKWVSDSLKELQKLGWIHLLEDDSEQFELLPAFERVALIYQDAINNVEEIRTTNA
ncbi:MAG: hypothetical protein A3F72_03670 [Bacteroidetes bacterium RIFCSPLOWO2_12_FULL_35_15]|nr:MAG: hypothetical protein A3F72_03670 [Bacteroidetes bacterium RIFCSPLOWO2_12_FULL_35_15]